MLMHDCRQIITLSSFAKPVAWLVAALVMLVNSSISCVIKNINF